MQMELNIDLDDFVHQLTFVDGDVDVKKMEQLFNCKIKVDIEKHNSLQYTYYYEVDFEKEECFFVAIESGIERGTVVLSEEWGYNTKPSTRTIEVLKDIIIDESQYDNIGDLRLAKAVFNANKTKLFDFIRQNNYDNYVTGGNSKMKLEKPLSQLHLDYIYEEKEVDCRFI